MLVARLSVHLSLYAADSLKEKRYVVKSVKDRLRQRFNVAVAEVGSQEVWRHAELGIATVAGERKMLDRTLDAVRTFLDGDTRFEMTQCEVEYY